MTRFRAPSQFARRPFHRLARAGWLVTLVALVTWVVLSGFVPGRAWAQEATEKVDSIRTYMEEGQGLYAAGKFQEAAKVFEAGYAKHPYSAFLFNAGVCYQKSGELEAALQKYNLYLKNDPQAPDAARVRAKVDGIEAVLAARERQTDPAATQQAEPKEEAAAEMKSLVLIESDPPGAPVTVYRRATQTATPFELDQENPGWTKADTTQTPANLTLDVGTYHVVIKKFQDFKASQTTLNISPGHVHQFRANLSQGEFMGYLRVVSKVEGARIHLDDPKKERPPWGLIPHAELVSAGEHTLSIEAPGYETKSQKLTIERGERKEIDVQLQRVGYGYLAFTANVAAFSLSVDGKLRGAWNDDDAPLEVKLDAGKHLIEAEADGYKTYSERIEVPRGQKRSVKIRMIKTYPRGAAWTQAIIGGVVIGGGIYLGLESNRLHDELNADRRAGRLSQDDERIVRGRWFSVGADVAFGVGGLLGILATYNFIKDPWPDSSAGLGDPKDFEAGQQARSGVGTRWDVGLGPGTFTLGGTF